MTRAGRDAPTGGRGHRQFRGLEDAAHMTHRWALAADPEAPATMNGHGMWVFLAATYAGRTGEPAARILTAHYRYLSDRYDTNVGRSVPATYNTYDVFLRAAGVAHVSAIERAGPLDWWRHRFARQRPPWCRCYGPATPPPVGRRDNPRWPLP